MADTHSGNLNVKATAELNPFLAEIVIGAGPASWGFLCTDQRPHNLTVPYAKTAGTVFVGGIVLNRGDEDIEAYLALRIDGTTKNTLVTTISAGTTEPDEECLTETTLSSRVKSVGTHRISWTLKARVPGGTWKNYHSARATYIIEPKPCTCTSWVNAECTAIGKRRQTRTCTPKGCLPESRIIDDVSCKPVGDITKVTLDGKLLPEGGTLDWILNDDAAVKVFFKNIGNVAGPFHIWLTDDTGLLTSIIMGCDVTTDSIPADSAEYYVDLCVFLPDAVKVKTLTAHITP